MRRYNWDDKKNERLIAERKISFEEIVFYIEKGDVLDIIEHPNQKRYKGQRMFIVRVKDYAYLVPFVEIGNETVLKTIIPSRKAARIYLKGAESDG